VSEPQQNLGNPPPGGREGSDRPLPRVGDTVSWTTFGGDHCRGVVVEMDGNVAHVRLPDGRKKCLEC
jgi:hypothetical protein